MEAAQANQRKVLWITCYGHMLTHLSMLIFPALLVPLAASFGWERTDAMVLSQGMYLLYGLGALPAGWLADRFGSVRMLRVFLLGMAAALVATGLAPTPLSFVVAGSILGFAASIYHPVGLGLISKTMPNRGWALGVNGIFGNIGLAAAPFLTGLITYRFGWRWAYIGVAAPTLAIGVLSLFLRVDESVTVVRHPRPAAHSARVPLYFGLLCLALVMGGFAYRGVSVVLPAAFEECAPHLASRLGAWNRSLLEGASTLSAALLTSLVYLVGIVGQIVGGRIADRRDLRVAYIVFHAASLPGLILMGWLANGWFLAATVWYVFFSLGMQPIENSLVASLTPDRFRSMGYGIKFTLTFGVGAVAVAAARAIGHRAGLAAIFPSMAVAVILIIGAAGLLYFTSRGWTIRND